MPPRHIILSLFAFTLSPNPVSADLCTHPTRLSTPATVTKVYDGDTVRIANGDKIRLIGINTPEMNHKTGKPEPFAQEALDFLKKRVLHKTIRLQPGKETRDHYQRKLAHIFDVNGKNIQAEILQRGLAASITIPPNLWQQDCYNNIEKKARQNRLGIWNSPYFQPLNASKLNANALGFRIISGHIKKVTYSKKYIWLTLSANSSIRIHKDDIKYFPSLNLKNLPGQNFIAKGWLNFYKQKYNMRIKHGNGISILPN